jgi:hypothetical protein
LPIHTSKKVNELYKIAENFTQRGCIKTGNVINSIANDVRKSKPVSNKKYQSILNLFREEYSREDADIAIILNFIMTAMLIPVIEDKTKFRNKFHELYPWLESYKERILLLSEFAQETFQNNTMSHKLKYLNLCIAYSWLVEAFFFDAIRFILIFVNLGYGKNVKYDQIKEKPIKTLREELKDLTESTSEILFSGYEDGHLRNSILHGGEVYVNSDDLNQIMHWVQYTIQCLLQNLQYDSVQELIEKEFPIDESLYSSEFSFYHRFKMFLSSLLKRSLAR